MALSPVRLTSFQDACLCPDTPCFSIHGSRRPFRSRVHIYQNRSLSKHVIIVVSSHLRSRLTSSLTGRGRQHLASNLLKHPRQLVDPFSFRDVVIDVTASHRRLILRVVSQSVEFCFEPLCHLPLKRKIEKQVLRPNVYAWTLFASRVRSQ